MPEVVRLPTVKRIEGHGTVSLILGDDGRVADAQFNVVEFRGFEKLVEGRMAWEMPLITSRVCGICPVSHHVASVKAIDALFGARIPAPAALLRELLQLAGFVHDHALHFFFLAGPDFLVGEGASRDILGVVEARPDLAAKAIAIRKAGQAVVEAVGGQAHPVTAIPGGMSRPLSEEARSMSLQQTRAALAGALEAERLARETTMRLLDENAGLSFSSTPMFAQMGDGRRFDVYDGAIHVSSADDPVVEAWDVSNYADNISERVLPFSYAKAPYLTVLGPEAGTYRVGPLARMDLALQMPGEDSSRLLDEFKAELGFAQHPLAYHWARMIELVAACERMIAILEDDAVTSADVRVKVERQAGVGIAAVEAPRGTLIHHYEADAVGRITKANLIVATTHNNAAINRTVAALAADAVVDGKVVPEQVRRIELGVRAYDPCLSCATHEVGRMPLMVEVLDHRGVLLDRREVGER